MRISDWSSDVCSSDLVDIDQLEAFRQPAQPGQEEDSRYDLDEKLRQGEVGCGEPGEGNADGEPGAAHENEGRKAMVLRLVGRAERTGGADGPDQRKRRVDRGQRCLAWRQPLPVKRPEGRQQRRADQKL